jgi:hypothetical protein
VGADKADDTASVDVGDGDVVANDGQVAVRCGFGNAAAVPTALTMLLAPTLRLSSASCGSRHRPDVAVENLVSYYSDLGYLKKGQQYRRPAC